MCVILLGCVKIWHFYGMLFRGLLFPDTVYSRLVLSLYIEGSKHKGSKCVFVRARNIPSVSIYFRSLSPLSPSFSGSFFR